MSAGSTNHTPIEVEVPLARSPYKVIVGPGLIRDCGARIAEILKPSRCALVTDTNVGPLHAEAVEASLRQAGFDPIRITLPSG